MGLTLYAASDTIKYNRLVLCPQLSCLRVFTEHCRESINLDSAPLIAVLNALSQRKAVGPRDAWVNNPETNGVNGFFFMVVSLLLLLCYTIQEGGPESFRTSKLGDLASSIRESLCALTARETLASSGDSVLGDTSALKHPLRRRSSGGSKCRTPDLLCIVGCFLFVILLSLYYNIKAAPKSRRLNVGSVCVAPDRVLTSPVASV